MRLNVNDVCYNIERVGSGEPLLLLHGFTGSVISWTGHAAVFGNQFSTVAIDFLGHGTSDTPNDVARNSMDWCVRDVVGILDQLEIGRANVLGYSMGGRVALHFAYAHPERVDRLILESASPGIKDEAERSLRAQKDAELAAIIERDGVGKFVEYWTNIPLFETQARLPQAVREKLERRRLENNSVGLANSLRGLGVGKQASLWESLHTIDVLTLLIAGALDNKYSGIAQQMAQAMPNARCETVPDAGHTIHLERPQTFDKLVLEFLGRKTSDGRIEIGD